MRKGWEQRFWAKVDKGGDCWNWTAAKIWSGYGKFQFNGSSVGAHRVAWTLLRGPIPEGLTVDHLCRNRACVNPAHMELVTRGVNVLRGDTITAANLHKTHCPKGHPYSGRNSNGQRFCRVCMRVSSDKHRAANRDAYNARKRAKRAAGLWA